MATAVLAASAAGAMASDSLDPAGLEIVRHRSSIAATPPAPLVVPSQPLVLDDGSREADVGYGGATALQFLWFNRFAVPDPMQAFDLEEIQVLFPPGPDLAAGAAIQLVVLTDTDADPTNGAVFRGAFDEIVQVTDGTSFSVYSLAPPLRLPQGSSDILIGVVNRFVSSGVSPVSHPAALDTTASAGRSWVALWATDPPDPPSLSGATTIAPIDGVVPGNWMIRGAGLPVPPPIVAVPGAGVVGLGGLALLLGLGGAALLRLR